MLVGDWKIRWLVGENDKGIYLEYYGIRKCREYLHERIYRSGEMERLEILREYMAYLPSLPGAREKRIKDVESYNTKILHVLRKRGLF